MKANIVQVACPGSSGNLDFTHTDVSGDLVGALFWGTDATANDTTSANDDFCFGATDLVGNLGVWHGMIDATAAAPNNGIMSNTHSLFQKVGSSNSGPQLAYGSTLSNGVRMALTSAVSGRMINAMLLSGADLEMKVGTDIYLTGNTTQDFTHGMASAPDVLLLFSVFGQAGGNETGGASMSVGAWDRATAVQSCVARRAASAANPTNITALSSATRIARFPYDNAAGITLNLTVVGATTFTVTSSGAPGTASWVGWVALRGVSAQLYSAAILASLPTAMGPAALVTGMAGKPQAVLMFPTRYDALNTVVNSDNAGALGVCGMASNDGTASTIGSSANTMKHAVATSVAKTRISTTKAALVLDPAGDPDLEGTVSSWDSGGLTLDYSNVGVLAFKALVLAFGAAAGGGAPAPINSTRRRRAMPRGIARGLR